MPDICLLVTWAMWHGTLFKMTQFGNFSFNFWMTIILWQLYSIEYAIQCNGNDQSVSFVIIKILLLQLSPFPIDLSEHKEFFSVAFSNVGNAIDNKKIPFRIGRSQLLFTATNACDNRMTNYAYALNMLSHVPKWMIVHSHLPNGVNITRDVFIPIFNYRWTISPKFGEKKNSIHFWSQNYTFCSAFFF